MSQAEYATDIAFRSSDDLAPLYYRLLRRAIYVVKFSDIHFVGRSPDESGNHQIGGDFSIRIHGTRVRHYLGPVSIKMYDSTASFLARRQRDLVPSSPDDGTARRQVRHDPRLH